MTHMIHMCYDKGVPEDAQNKRLVSLYALL